VMSRIVTSGPGSSGNRYYAFVAPGTRRFGVRLVLTKLQVSGSPENIARIFDPGGKEIAGFDYRARMREWDGKLDAAGAAPWTEFAVDVPRGMDGKIWQLELPPYILGRKFELIGASPYIAATRESCFEIPPRLQ
jgi:hypothetical protein